MNDKEIGKLRGWCKSRLGENFDLFDFEHEVDRSISYSEAKDEMEEKLLRIVPDEEDMKDYKNKEIKYKILEKDFKEKWLTQRSIFSERVLEEFKTIAVYGDTGTGKTALVYKILETLKGRPVFFVKHPKPELIKKLGYANLRNLEELERLQDCVIYYDEPQLSTSIYDNKSNMIIAKVCSLARQRNIILIISSSDTRVFSRHNEAYFDLWLIKDVDFSMVKNGSKIKKAIKDNSILDPEGFRLDIDEFVIENRKMPELNGRHKFKKSKSWNEELSVPYRNSE